MAGDYDADSQNDSVEKSDINLIFFCVLGSFSIGRETPLLGMLKQWKTFCHASDIQISMDTYDEWAFQ